MSARSSVDPAPALALVSGALMAVYLVLRPYGDADAGDTLAAAEAYSSLLWIVSHVAGAAALVALAALWSTVATGWPRWASLTGVAMVLPYYGAETFALHEIGARALAGDAASLDLVAAVRDNPVAMTLFGIGLIALAAAGIGAAGIGAAGIGAAMRRRPVRERTAESAPDGSRLSGGELLPLVVVATLFLPQFFMPPVGRMAYGIVFAVAAGHAALRLRSPHRRTPANWELNRDTVSATGRGR